MNSFDERTLFTRGPVVVFRWRNEEGWPVEHVSSNVQEIFGHSAEAFVSGAVSYAQMIHPDDVERVGAEVVAGAADPEGSFEHAPYRITRADGSERWVYDTTYVVRPDGADEPSHFVGYVIDVTRRIVAESEQKSLELRILQNEKLESLNILAAGVAHDFNNLLTGILGQSELAQLMLEPGPSEVRRSLATIEQLAERAAVLIRQLGSYSGKGKIEAQQVNMTQLVRDSAELMKPLISKHTRLHLDLSEQIDFRADPTQMRQVVMNLIANGSESLGGKDGEINISLNRSARSGQKDEYVTLTVSDNGCGMSEDVASKIFVPFFTTKATGHGLGMSSVQGIVRAHHGEILVQSELGQGTRFELVFPV